MLATATTCSILKGPSIIFVSFALMLDAQLLISFSMGCSLTGRIPQEAVLRRRAIRGEDEIDCWSNEDAGHTRELTITSLILKTLIEPWTRCFILGMSCRDTQREV